MGENTVDGERDAQSMNITAAVMVANAVKSTLGPKGMDKMLVDEAGNAIVTNDGVTILNEMNIVNPAARMVADIAQTQEDEIGDGTTTAVVLAGALLKEAQALLDDQLHPTVIAEGYRLAAEHASEAVRSIARPCTADDASLLRAVAETAMTGKGAEPQRHALASSILDAVRTADEANIRVEGAVGGAVEDTELIHGIVIDQDRVTPRMPASVADAKVAVVTAPLEVQRTETKAKINVTDPDDLERLMELEDSMLAGLAERIVASGADVVFCMRGIDDVVQHALAEEGIYATRRVRRSDLEQIAHATGATLVGGVDELGVEALGRAGVVRRERVGDRMKTFIREGVDAEAVTLLVRGGTAHVVDEVERAVRDAIGDVVTAVDEGFVVPGAGAAEVAAAGVLRERAESLSGREQLAVQAFADALEVVPRTLAANAGLDPIDVVTALRSAHDDGVSSRGVDVNGLTADSWELGVVEPLRIKTQAVSSAMEVAVMILRIDDVIQAKPRDEGKDFYNL